MKNTQELLAQLLEGLREGGDTLGSAVFLESSATGDDIPAAHKTKILKWMRQEPEDWSSVHTFPVLMIDTAPTRNAVLYTAESQKKTIKKWPGTTFLFNAHAANPAFGNADHTLQAASQMARIYDARLVKTPTGEIGTLGWFYSVEGIDQHVDGFIGKLEAGILREVSIHVQVPEGVICSICNDTFDKCNDNAKQWHYPGEKYGSKNCYMSTGTGALTPLELSSVACPGSVNAHVMADDDVDNYPVTTLREALGGSREAIDTIRNQQEIIVDKAAARQKLAELAAAAGVSLKEAVANDENKELAESAAFEEAELEVVEASDCEKCGHAAHEGSECSACEAAKNAADPPEEEEAVHLFDGDCPACGRSKEVAPVANAEADSAKIVKIRTEFQTAVQAVVDAAKEKAEATAAALASADEVKAERDALFSDLVEQTVTLAIERGVKPESERDACRESFSALSSQAVRELRTSYKMIEAPAAKTAAKLVENMTERAQRLLGATVVVETADGKKTTQPATRARFAAASTKTTKK